MSDAFVQRFLGRDDTKEALNWLTEQNDSDFRTPGEMESPEESIALVKRLYSLGAVEVLAVEIDVDPDLQNTGKLVIKVPTDAEQRRNVLSWAAEVAEQQGFDDEQDHGQTYVFVMLD